MFEQDRAIVKVLLENSREFKRLYEKHTDLKKQVNEAQRGGAPSIAIVELEKMKKRKLRLKDRMAQMIEAHRAKGT